MDEKHKRDFSLHNRERILNEMADQTLDLLVIGGGITGCGVALDASLRGLKVGLLEMQDFAAGTSSRSTKLIHGGLRYLKQGEIKLVREVGHERAILYHNAPHIVLPEPMLLPLYKGGSYGKWMTSIGLWMYDRLAGVSRAERREMLGIGATLDVEPLLKREGLRGSGRYVEYRTDDARLTVEVMKTAASFGALAVNYAKVTQFIYEQGRVSGVLAEDTRSQQQYTIRAKQVVNATGPWVDTLRKENHSLQGKRLHLTKGVHIVVDHSRFPLQQAVYFDANDGRMIFAIPRDDTTYIGTTDTTYVGDLLDPQMNEEDKSYLLQATNEMFPSLKLQAEDICAHWVGLRPLIHQEGKSPSELSRKDEVFISDSGLITIAGGKLTGFRKMAQRVVDIAVAQLQLESDSHSTSSTPSQTERESRSSSGIPQTKSAAHPHYGSSRSEHQVLSGGNVGGPDRWPDYLREKTTSLVQLGLDRKRAEQYVRRYGSNIDDVLSNLPQATDGTPSVLAERWLVAEVMYGIKHEMVVTAEDFLIRRTGAAYFDTAYVHEVQEKVASLIKDTYKRSPPYA